MLDPEITSVIVFTSISGVLILFRCCYRLLSICRIHTICHRTWHSDDAWMAFAVLPLAGRCACIVESFAFDHNTGDPEGQKVGRKLQIPARVFYAFFLWCMKLALLSFYSRFAMDSTRYKRAVTILRWFFVISFFIIIIPTVAECRPLYIYWNPDPEDKYSCRKARGNLLTMAVLNIGTDIALFVFPIPLIWNMSLSFPKKLQLIILFGVGLVVVAITITRLPLILSQSTDHEIRSIRSRWASIEMFCACVVANAAFYYALLKDLSRGHNNSPSQMTALAVRQSTLRMAPTSEDWKSQYLPGEITFGPLPPTATRSLNSWEGLNNGLPTSTHVEEIQLQPKDYYRRENVTFPQSEHSSLTSLPN